MQKSVVFLSNRKEASALTRFLCANRLPRGSRLHPRILFFFLFCCHKKTPLQSGRSFVAQRRGFAPLAARPDKRHTVPFGLRPCGRKQGRPCANRLPRGNRLHPQILFCFRYRNEKRDAPFRTSLFRWRREEDLNLRTYLSRLHDFESCAFDRSAISAYLYLLYTFF